MKHLPKIFSDHYPISTCGYAPIPMVLKPFRFQAVWLIHEKFEEFVLENWDNNQPLIPFLANFSAKLNLWNKNIFHNILKRKPIYGLD